MNHFRSLIACFLVLIVSVVFRIHYSGAGADKKPLVITQWDAFGYYLYLPAITIYKDISHLKWADSIDRKYNVTGGDGMPVQHLENGNLVCKYLGGVAILQAPFFAVGHFIASVSGLPTDGFSPPYQYSLAFAVILYCFLSLLLLRRLLLRFFEDQVVAISILLLCLATNFLQYASRDSGLSHAWIFPLYVLLIFSTMRWHDKPQKRYAFLTGLILGWATICRPTEAVALFIPLLWNTHNREEARKKWALVKANRMHIIFAIAGGLIGILPQLIYWKQVTGSFIYDVGSKWFFLNPWFRVLFGWEKGWFIYTPVTVLFVLGLLFIKKYPFRYSVLIYCLVTIWIVIAWEDWQYGASYSTRALVQSYPVFAFPLAALISKVTQKKWKLVFCLICVYLILVNLFQIVQYNSTVLHFRDMNRRYYSRIYLNPKPTAIDMSLLDVDEVISDEKAFKKSVVATRDIAEMTFSAKGRYNLVDTVLNPEFLVGEYWLKVEARISAPGKLWKSELGLELRIGDTSVVRSVRLFNPVGEKTGLYMFYVKVPPELYLARLQVFVRSDFDFEGTLTRLMITGFSKGTRDLEDHHFW